MDDLRDKIGFSPKQPKPGLSNEAKRVKDQLEEDPFNLELMLQLGNAYANDHQFQKCCNVLLRGWKRVHELPEDETRFEFLMLLCEASGHLAKHKQALAVLGDIQEPSDPEDRRSFAVLACQVHAHNGNVQQCLRFFHVAMDGADFDSSLGSWASCALAMKEAGCYMQARAAMQQRLQTEEESQKFEALETLVEYTEQFNASSEAAPSGVSWGQSLVILLGVILFGALVYYLYLLEKATFDQLRTAAGK